MRRLIGLLTLISLFSSISLMAQRPTRLITGGIQFRPMLPVGFFNGAEQSSVVNDTTFTINQNFGYSAGGVIRFGFNDRFALETGISFVQRNFTLSAEEQSGGFNQELSYRIIGYELPIRGLVYVQLDRQWFMTATFGPVLDFFPSDVATANDYIQHETIRNSWIAVGLDANIGFEYRTKENGIFYLGGSFHRPFSNIYLSKIGAYQAQIPETTIELFGDYLTVDLRYFFHADPEPKKRKKKKD